MHHDSVKYPLRVTRRAGACWSSYSMNHLTMTLLKLPDLLFTSSLQLLWDFPLPMLINLVSVSFKILNLCRGQQKAICSFINPLRKHGKLLVFVLTHVLQATRIFCIPVISSYKRDKQNNKSRDARRLY